MGQFSLTIRDYSREESTHRINTGPINAASLANVLTQVAAYEAAVAGVTLGVQAREHLSVFNNALSGATPGSSTAQREMKWAVSWIDTTQYLDPPVNSILNPYYGQIFTETIPTANPAQLTVPGSDIVDLLSGNWPAFVTAFQALARSKSNGQPQITKITFVGRNL